MQVTTIGVHEYRVLELPLGLMFFVIISYTSTTGGKVHYSLQLHHSDEAKKAIFVVSVVDKVYTKVRLNHLMLL